MEDIDIKVKEKFGTWKEYSKIVGQDPSNFKRTIIRNIEKMNNWLSYLGLRIKVESINNEN